MSFRAPPADASQANESGLAAARLTKKIAGAVRGEVRRATKARRRRHSGKPPSRWRPGVGPATGAFPPVGSVATAGRMGRSRTRSSQCREGPGPWVPIMIRLSASSSGLARRAPQRGTRISMRRAAMPVSNPRGYRTILGPRKKTASAVILANSEGGFNRSPPGNVGAIRSARTPLPAPWVPLRSQQMSLGIRIGQAMLA